MVALPCFPLLFYLAVTVAETESPGTRLTDGHESTNGKTVLTARARPPENCTEYLPDRKFLSAEMRPKRGV